MSEPTEQTSWTLPCPGRHHDDDPAPGAPTWCTDCHTSIDHALAALPSLLATAAARRDGRLNVTRAATDTTRRSTPAPGSPSPAADTIDAVARWARQWCETLADQLGKRHAHQGPVTATALPVLTVRDDVDYLRAFLTPLLAGPDAAEFGTAALGVHATLRRLADVDQATTRLPGPCPTCDRIALVQEVHQDRERTVTIQCRACGTPTTETIYTEHVAHLATQQRAAG